MAFFCYISKKVIHLNQCETIKNKKMETFGIKVVDTQRLESLYKWKTEKELKTRIENSILETAKETGTELELQDNFLISLKELAENVFDMNFNFFVLKTMNIWSWEIEKAMSDIIMIGDGECEECGGGPIEFWDYGENGPDLGKCCKCENVQPIK